MCYSKQIPRAVIVFLALCQMALFSTAWSQDTPGEVSFRQLMSERNVRLKQLGNSNDRAFDELLKQQANDRSALKNKDLTAAARREMEQAINDHYKKLMDELAAGKKGLEGRIYEVWKKSGGDLQAGNPLDEQRWDSMDTTLSDFVETFFSAMSEQPKLDSKQKELAAHIETCSLLEQKYEHPFTGDSLLRSIRGFEGDECHYIEELPGGGRMECFYPRDKIPAIADFYLHPTRFEGAKIESHTEFVDDQPVTTTRYIVDGEVIFHPLGESMENGECKVLGYE